jgi:pimeloyl-ACP methyl ester carboxylesterase
MRRRAVRILFLHGWTSRPGGVKPTYLAAHGHEVVNPPLPDDDFEEAVRRAQEELNRCRADVVVGSSRGGAVAMNLRAGGTPLVLLCPAWKRWGRARTVPPGTLILHAESDDVVPIEDSRELLRASGLPASALRVVGDDHRLADPASLAAMLQAVEAAGPRAHPPSEPVVPSCESSEEVPEGGH